MTIAVAAKQNYRKYGSLALALYLLLSSPSHSLAHYLSSPLALALSLSLALALAL